VGALSCSKLLFMSKLKLMMLLNLTLAIGVGISLIGEYIWLMSIGRFIWGVAYGAFSVVCTKMINEFTPIELIGPFGAMNQLSLTFGAALPSTLALAYPPDIKTAKGSDDFYVNQYFRIIWAMPLVISLLQVILMSTVFKNESPVYLKMHG